MTLVTQGKCLLDRDSVCFSKLLINIYCRSDQLLPTVLKSEYNTDLRKTGQRLPESTLESREKLNIVWDR